MNGYYNWPNSAGNVGLANPVQYPDNCNFQWGLGGEGNWRSGFHALTDCCPKRMPIRWTASLDNNHTDEEAEGYEFSISVDGYRGGVWNPDLGDFSCTEHDMGGGDLFAECCVPVTMGASCRMDTGFCTGCECAGISSNPCNNVVPNPVYLEPIELNIQGPNYVPNYIVGGYCENYPQPWPVETMVEGVQIIDGINYTLYDPDGGGTQQTPIRPGDSVRDINPT
jgi:hypothetical protein